MHAFVRLFVAAAVAGTMALATHDSGKAQTATPPANATTLELSVSKDGRAIVDQNGKVIARFARGTRVRTATKAAGNKLQGCFHCTRECVVYDGDRCVQYIRSCTWDFDCK